MVDRTAPPQYFAVDHVDLIEALPFTLDNGIQGFFINAGAQPVMRLEFIFRVGKKQEAAPGISFFAGKMLPEGTEAYNAAELFEFFDSLGAFIEVAPGFDYINLTVHFLNKHLDRLLPVIAEILYQPRFGEEELQNLKKIKRQQLKVELQRNNLLASRKFREAIFKDSHPYGQSLELAHIDQVEASSLRNYFEDFMRHRIEIIASGQIGAEEIASINSHLGQLPAQTVPMAARWDFQYQPTELLLEKEDSLQSSIRVGSPIISRKHNDYWKLAITNEILGGYFGSRLMKNIREEKGYTYGIHSALSHLEDQSMFVIGTDVKKEYRLQTLFEIRSEIKKLQNELVSGEELKTVTHYMAGSFAADVNSPFALAEKFKTLHFNRLDYQHYSDFFKTLKDITPDDIIETSRKYFDLDLFSQVVVG